MVVPHSEYDLVPKLSLSYRFWADAPAMKNITFISNQTAKVSIPITNKSLLYGILTAIILFSLIVGFVISYCFTKYVFYKRLPWYAKSKEYNGGEIKKNIERE
jgi:hypothetical protein